MADLELDYEAIGKILREQCGPAIHRLAVQVADNIRGDSNLPEGATVSVKDYVTDRAVSVVLIGHRDAQAAQAKYGLLTKAAAGAGLEVTAK